ncbi:glycosyltransferase [Nocardioides zeae]|uniref:Glycosyltransferase n=1 Tax=Nocardioides imazamoxiresistens TaxID=3231893 RepID=A0ABU3Q177_9ACTN|nr:glycosyltransferase [Nocardioides zeae]MDT9595262.1 glycosyltransferase [Nocardioides zeae]
MRLPEHPEAPTGTSGAGTSGTDRPRVGYVLTMFPRFSETFVLNELLALEAAGTEVRVLSLRQPDDGRFHAALGDLRARVTYVTRPSRASSVWSVLASVAPDLPRLAEHLPQVLALPVEEGVAALEVAAAAVREGLTHLHAHFANSPATVARVAAALAGIGYSLTAHAKDVFHDGLDAVALQANLRQASAVVTVSDFNVRFLRELCPAAADRVVRVYNGLDLERFAFRAGPREPRTVVAVGRLVPKKGFDVLLQATALLVRTGGDPVRVRIVGSGAEEPRLRELAARLRITDRVEFCGALPQDRMKEVVASATVFAAPCVVAGDGNRDGLPTVLLEALALGTPCVATPVTGIPEAVVDGVTGRLVPEGDATALAAALLGLLDSPADRAAYAAAGRALVERDFDVRRNALLLDEVFGVPAPRAAVPA